MRRVLISLVVFALSATVSSAQNFQKVVEIVDQMETSLKKMITQEQVDRKSDIAALRIDLEHLRSQQAATDTTAKRVAPEPRAGFEKMEQRLAKLEQNLDRTNANLGELTKALALLVGELKRTTPNPKTGLQGQP
jgi:hypothetical protein